MSQTPIRIAYQGCELIVDPPQKWVVIADELFVRHVIELKASAVPPKPAENGVSDK